MLASRRAGKTQPVQTFASDLEKVGRFPEQKCIWADIYCWAEPHWADQIIIKQKQ
jgi:hypothetical protein